MKMRSVGGAPIFLQVVALALLSVVAAQVINLGVILTLPDPPPQGYSVTEAAQALRGAPVTTRDGKRLSAKLQDAPPDFPALPHRGLEQVISRTLAGELGVPAERVRVALPPDMHFKMRMGPDAPQMR